MEKYTFSIAERTANGSVNSDRLKAEIQNSAILVSLHHIDTNSDVLDIWFNTALSSEDIDLLTELVALHDGTATVPVESKYDEEGGLIVSSMPVFGSGTWLVSDNICSESLPSDDPSWGGNPPSSIGTMHENGGMIVYEWVPTPGKKLYCVETQLICSANVDLSTAEMHFIGVNAGPAGTQNFDRKYTEQWGRAGYRVQADKPYQDLVENRLYWKYTVPIVLKSSYGGKIVLTRSGPMTGSYAFVKIKVNSLAE